jgi:hypothetical protein
VLFQETEEVLDPEAQEIHYRQVGQSYLLWATKEKPEWAFVTWCAISLQELNS